MTMRTFFDKGVYKTTLKRFSIGSVLYFIMLFLCTGMLLLLTYEPEWDYNSAYFHILDEEFVYPAMWIALFVPTVVALLCYRFMHSKKTSIFVHSLPVTRKANYISSLAGAFTLMALPVILNAVVLFAISLCGYSSYFNGDDIALWVLLNLLVLFVMFSVSTFAAMCTGNSFALVIINAILLFAPLLIATVTETVLLEFLYGYSYKRNLLDFATEINPVFFLAEVAEGVTNTEEFDWVRILAFLGVAIVLYVLSYFMYKYRHTETSEDIAGFKVLNPIFKHFVTFVGTIAVFSLFSQFLGEKSVLFTFLVILASAIFYFGCEMLLKKTVKVWHSYKGYLVFGGVFTAFILFLGLTSVFGYETYVPEFENVEEAAIYNYYYRDEEPFTANAELNKYIIEVHRELTKSENRTILNHDDYSDTRLHITYKLKNGKVVTRRYGVSHRELERIMDEVMSYMEYREACFSVFAEDVDKIESIGIAGYDIEEDSETLGELFECIKADFSTLSYENLYYGGPYCYVNYYSTRKDLSVGIEVPERYQDVVMNNFVSENGPYNHLQFNITRNFEKTLKWLYDNGYKHVVAAALRDNSLEVSWVDIPEVDKIVYSISIDDVEKECVIEDKADIEAISEIFDDYYIEREEEYNNDIADVYITFGSNMWFTRSFERDNMFRLNDTDLYTILEEDEMDELIEILKKYGMVSELK